MCGSLSRVLVMLITGTAIRNPVPGPRLDWRMSGRPGSSSFWMAPVLFGNPISGNWLNITRPPRSKTRKMSPTGIVSHAGSGNSFARIPLSVMKGVGGTGLTSVAGSPLVVYASPTM